MKITNLEPLVCDAGWRPWIFVKIQTDEGIVGYGECTDNRTPRSVLGAIEDLKDLVIGRDPRHVEMIYWDMYRHTRHSVGGAVQKGIAGIDCALWDIKGKAFGAPVFDLVGGPTHDKVKLYWTHCGSYRLSHGSDLGTPPVRRLEDIRELAAHVAGQGFSALKTNALILDGSPRVFGEGFGGGFGTTARNLDPAILRHIEAVVRAFREGAGDDIEIAIDLNFNFTTEGFIRMIKAFEPYDLSWVELDCYDPGALLQIKDSTRTPICSGESLYTTRGYRPYFELHSLDIAMVDVPWNGFTASRKIADFAEPYEISICPHNYYSHLSTMISGHLCASVPNVRIMECEIEDVPWKDDIVTRPPRIEDGYLWISDGAGWGTDLNEKEIKKRPWQ